MKTWLTADWHLGEDRFELMGRPFTNVNDHVYALQREHNAVVGPEDRVFVVGDVVYQKATDWLKHINIFNGRKILIRGNHDRVFTDEQLKPYFEQIIPDGGGIEIEVGGIKCYITHYPTEGRPNRFNLVGHVHSAWKYQLNSFNIGVDVNHFRPVDLESVPKHLTAIEKYYDEDVWVAYNLINVNPATENRGKRGTYFRPAKTA